jgi:hypothetical protein
LSSGIGTDDDDCWKAASSSATATAISSMAALADSASASVALLDIAICLGMIE